MKKLLILFLALVFTSIGGCGVIMAYLALAPDSSAWMAVGFIAEAFIIWPAFEYYYEKITELFNNK